jgi:beta-carotene 15,15'-dioxygenase
LSLSVGMGHGALDAVLMLAQFKPYRNVAAYALVYLLLVVGCGALLTMSPGWALLALLAMSVWHFGELYSPSLTNRLLVGGASVMAPMLLSNAALAAVLKPALGVDFAATWLVWYWLALTWAVGAVAWVLGLVVQRINRRGSRSAEHLDHENALTRAGLELAAVLALNAVLSPLMAFAVYFGLWHSLSHIARVLRAMARHSSRAKVSPKRLALAMALTGLATAALLWVLWRWLAVGQGADGLSALGMQAFWVQWLVVALAAVTLPHMLLVGYSHRWLGR